MSLKLKKHQARLIQTGHVLQAECKLIKAPALDYVLKEQYVLEQENQTFCAPSPTLCAPSLWGTVKPHYYLQLQNSAFLPFTELLKISLTGLQKSWPMTHKTFQAHIYQSLCRLATVCWQTFSFRDKSLCSWCNISTQLNNETMYDFINNNCGSQPSSLVW